MEAVAKIVELDPVAILMVDDRAENLRALEAVLTRPDYLLVATTSGDDALTAVLRQDFAVILLDVSMPGLDGFQTAELLRQRKKAQGIPIIFVTGMMSEGPQIFRGYETGAVDYLVKPIDSHTLRAKVAVFVELHRRALELERLAEALHASESRFARLRESGILGVFVEQADGTVIEANDAFLRLTRFTRDDLASGVINSRAPQPPEFSDAEIRARDELRARGSCSVYEREFTRKDGKRLTVMMGSTLVDAASKDVIDFMIDVTERKEVEREKARLVAELSETLRSRDDFVSLTAHELKNPLTPIEIQVHSLLSLAQTRPSVETAWLERQLQPVARATNRLCRLVDQLLEVSRITVGRLRIELENIDSSATVSDVAERMRPEAERAGCTLRLSTEIPVRGQWDRARIEQAVGNLLSNAIKYGPGKPIEISVKPAAEVGRFSIRDYGIGIDPAEQARIFERFERLMPVRHYGGFGLGLWIVRQIVEAHGGHVEVWSRPGEGSRFTVELPLTT